MNGIKIEKALNDFKEQITNLQSEKDFYNFEKKYLELWQQAGRQVFEASISKNLDVKKSKKKR
jgi:hypothetical protein